MNCTSNRVPFRYNNVITYFGVLFLTVNYIGRDRKTARPHDCKTYFDYLSASALLSENFVKMRYFV